MDSDQLLCAVGEDGKDHADQANKQRRSRTRGASAAKHGMTWQVAEHSSSVGHAVQEETQVSRLATSSTSNKKPRRGSEVASQPFNAQIMAIAKVVDHAARAGDIVVGTSDTTGQITGRKVIEEAVRLKAIKIPARTEERQVQRKTYQKFSCCGLCAFCVASVQAAVMLPVT